MNWAENSLKKLKHAQDTLGKRSGPNVIWLRENEDDSALRMVQWNLSTGIPTMSSALNDFEEGLACLAGRPNAGKSTILVNIITQSCLLNEDIMVVDISLDDPYKKRYEQYIASLTGLYYQEITTVTALHPNKQKLKDEADELIKEWYSTDKLRTIEASEYITDDFGGEPMKISYRRFDNIVRLMRDVKKQYPDKKIVFVIDAWNNLDVSGAKGNSDLSQVNYQLNFLKESAEELGVMVWVSAHLRKTDNKKPTLEDIKGTSDMAYNVVWAGLVRNEYRENSHKDPLMYTDSDGKVYPIVAIEIPKTKVSSSDLVLLYILKSGQCQIIPLTRDEYEEYRDKYNGR